MYERLYRLYRTGKITKAGLRSAVKKGWITEEEFKSITGEDEGEQE